MRIKISALKGKKGDFLTIKKEISGAFLKEFPEVNDVTSPLSLQLKVTNSGDGFLVEGQFYVNALLICARCVQPFAMKISGEIEDTFVPADLHENDYNDGALFDTDLPTYSGDELDLTNLIHESVLLALPMKVVCSEECQGLCPVCGKMRGVESCDCQDPAIDPRLAPLADLFKK